MKAKRYAKYLSVRLYRVCDCGERLCPDPDGTKLHRWTDQQREAVGVTPKP